MNQRTSTRARELAKIHILKKVLDLDDETYRGILHDFAECGSAGDADQRGRWAVIEHLRKLKGEIKPRATSGDPDMPRNLSKKPLLRKIHALLARAGLPWSYAHGIFKRMWGGPRCDWGTDEQLRAVVTALVKKSEKSR